jgi:hypothetical protein
MKILFVREPKGIDAIELTAGRLRVEMASEPHCHKSRDKSENW